jgi:regulator of protease activity HflC (stomatin/prohibitin superfamily)
VQSVEGLSVGIDLTVRYALDPARIAATARTLPASLDAEIVEPAVQNVVYKVFARYTVREIFSTKRAEIQQALEADLRPRLAADGVLLKGVLVGKVDLPADYKRGMERLLARSSRPEDALHAGAQGQAVQETELEATARRCGARCGPKRRRANR